MTVSDKTAEPVRPIPPRYWWLKRIALAVGIFVLALAGVRLWWGHVAESRLQAKIAAYHAAGEPILVADFVKPPVPDEENAAYFLQQAGAEVSQVVEVSDIVRDLRNQGLDPTAARKFLADNAEALRLARIARAKVATDWQIPLQPLVIAPRALGALTGQRTLARTISGAALYAHALRDDAAALELLRDNLALSRHVERMEIGVIAYMTGAAINQLGISVVENVANDLAVSDQAGSPEGEAQPATRKQVRTLIQDLLDETEVRASWRRCMRHERMEPLDTVVTLCSGSLRLPAGPALGQSLAERGVALVLGPAWKLDVLRIIDRVDAALGAGLVANWPTARQQLPPERNPASAAEEASEFFSRHMMASHDRVVLIHFWLLADRRMAATALAMRLYELDHGERPAALDELVPDYLPAVPLDPLDPNDAPLRYLRDAASPLLYSVGNNGVDDGGVVVLKSPGVTDRDAGDRLFYLNGDCPLPPPAPTSASAPAASEPTSTQAVVDDEQVEGTQEGQPQQDHEDRREQPE